MMLMWLINKTTLTKVLNLDPGPVSDIYWTGKYQFIKQYTDPTSRYEPKKILKN